MSKKIKILQVLSHYLPAQSFGGVLQSAHALSRALLAYDTEIRVCTGNMKTHTENLDLPTDKIVETDGVNVIYNDILYTPKQLRYWGVSKDYIRNLREQILWSDIVVLHFHYQYVTWIAALICRYYGRPYIICTHGSLNKRALEAKGTWRKQIYLKLIEGRNFRQARYIAYQSEEERHYSIQSPRSIILPNGIEPKSFEPSPPKGILFEIYPQLKGKFIFLYLGRIDPNKGIDILVPAFAQVHQAIPNSVLVIAGPDMHGYQAIVEQQISDLGIDKSVLFTGYIGGDTKLATLQDSNAFILPSRYEGLSMAMLEAIYHNLPVITTPYVGLSNRLKEEKAALIVNLDVSELADNMQRLIEDREWAQQIAQRGQTLIKTQYRWADIAKSFHDQLHEIVS